MLGHIPLIKIANSVTPSASTTMFIAIKLVLLVTFLGYIYCDLVEGQQCTFKDDETGQCKSLVNCESAIKDLREQRLPQKCGYKGSMPIVCCRNENDSKRTNSLPMAKGRFN